jgi:transcriptional coactivator HFI1/ADA1
MPDLSLDPSALTFNQPTLPTLPSKASLAAAQAAKNAAKPSNVVPRVDLEPLYASLKVAIGEHWAAYKEAVGLFVIGMRCLI